MPPDFAGADGVFRREDALLAGVPAARIDDLLRRGVWRRLQFATYVDRDTELTPRVRARAAILGSNLRDAVASHETAARLLGIEVTQDRAGAGRGPEHITAHRTGRRSHRPELRIHAHDLRAGESGHVAGLPCTTAARTLRDLLLDADRLTAVWAGEHALRNGLVTGEQLAAELLRASRHARIGRARRRLALVEPRSESPLESGVRLVLLDAWLPAPAVQLAVRVGRLTVRIDLAYEARRVAIETDGRTVHDTPAALYYDRQRSNDLLLAGWRVLRFTWYDLTRRPGYVVATVRAALAAAA